MSGFTKGPWQVSTHFMHAKWVVESTVEHAEICQDRAWGKKYEEESLANARLIASSPELYEAGKRVTDAFRAMGNAAGIVEVRDARIECEQALLALDAALSKAAGEGV